MGRAIVNNSTFRRGGRIKKHNINIPIRDYSNPQGMQEGASMQPNGMMFGFGGDIGGILSSISPLLAAIPGAGIPLSIGAGLAGTGLQATNKPEQQPMMGDGGKLNAPDYYDPQRAAKFNKPDTGLDTKAVNALSSVPPFNIILGLGDAASNGLARKDSQINRMNDYKFNHGYNSGKKYAEGGQTGMVPINVEGGNRSQGNTQQMRKGELLANRGKILKNYVARPPHPNEGMNPQGDTNEQEGMTVIPKNRTEEYLSADRKSRKMIEESLKSQQDFRANRALNMLKKGGLIHSSMYAKGGRIKMDYGGNYSWTSNGNIPTDNPYNPAETGTNVPLHKMDPMQMTSNPNYANFQDTTSTPTYSELSKTEPDQNYNQTEASGLSLNTNHFGSRASSRRNSSETSPSSKFGLNDILSYAAPAYNLGQGLFGKTEKLNPKDYQTNIGNPRYIDKNTGRREMLSAYASGKENVSGNLPGTVALNSQYQQNEADRNLKIDNINSGIYNDWLSKKVSVDQGNNQMKYGISDWNARSGQAKNNFLAAGMGDLSQIGQNNKRNETMRGLYNSAFPNASRMKRGGRVAKMLNY